MLRITKINHSPIVTLRLEGKLTAPWLVEVRAACASVSAQSPPRLDLSAVSFVDAQGLAFLHEMLAGGTELAACSNFISELLQTERP